MSTVAKRLDASGYHRLGTEVGLGPGDIVLDGDQPPSYTEKGTAASAFRPMPIVAKPISAADSSFFQNNRRIKKHSVVFLWSMPNVMAALPNISGALCSTPQSFADANY